MCLLIPDSEKYLKSKFGIRNTFFENNATNPAYVSSRYETAGSIGWNLWNLRNTALTSHQCIPPSLVQVTDSLKQNLKKSCLWSNVLVSRSYFPNHNHPHLTPYFTPTDSYSQLHLNHESQWNSHFVQHYLFHQYSWMKNSNSPLSADEMGLLAYNTSNSSTNSSTLASFPTSVSMTMVSPPTNKQCSFLDFFKGH